MNLIKITIKIKIKIKIGYAIVGAQNLKMHGVPMTRELSKPSYVTRLSRPAQSPGGVSLRSTSASPVPSVPPF